MLFALLRFFSFSIIAIVFSIKTAYAGCITFQEVEIEFRYSEARFNNRMLLLQLDPTLSFDGNDYHIKGAVLRPSGYYAFQYCVSPSDISSENVIFSIASHQYDNVTLADSEVSGVRVHTILETAPPMVAFIEGMRVLYSPTREKVVVRFNVLNASAIGFDKSPIISLRWSTGAACATPQRVQKSYVIEVLRGSFAVTETTDGLNIPEELLDASFADASLSGDYCSDRGVVLRIRTSPLSLDPEIETQEVIVSIDLSESAKELLEASHLSLEGWSVIFKEAQLAQNTFEFSEGCAAEPALALHSPPKRQYFSGANDHLRNFAVANAEAIGEYSLQRLAEFSSARLGVSPQVTISYAEGRRCFDTPFARFSEIVIPPAFAELLLLKAEDIQIANIMLDDFLISPPTDLLRLKDTVLCTYATINSNHRNYEFGYSDICGTAFDDFYRAWRSIRESEEGMSPVARMYRDALLFGIAHEYAHIALGHTAAMKVTRSNEIEADIFAFDYLTNTYDADYAFFSMKLFISVFADMLKMPNEWATRDDTMRVLLNEVGHESEETERYLNSECRIFRIVSQAGYVDELRFKVSDLGDLGALNPTLTPAVNLLIEHLTLTPAISIADCPL